MLSVNGVPLDNRALGWFLRPGSNPFVALTLEAMQVVAPGTDGHAPIRSRFTAPVFTLVVNVEVDKLEVLNSVFAVPELTLRRTDAPDRTITARLLSSTVDRIFSGGRLLDMAYVVELPGAYWRGTEVVTPATTLTAATHVVPCLPGLSAPVADAVVRVKGAAGSVQVTDAGGSWFTIPNVPAGQWARFHADSGRAFLMTTAAWTGGTEISGEVDFNGPRRQFEITPMFPDPTEPTTREGRLTVATASRVGASIEVRARPAFLV